MTEKTAWFGTEQPIKHFEELVLTKLKLRAMTGMTADAFQNVKIREQFAEMIADDLYVVAADMLLPAKETTHVLETHHVPATWWDHFKMRFFPHLGFKTNEIVERQTVYHVCPHLEVPHCERASHFRWLMAAGEGER